MGVAVDDPRHQPEAGTVEGCDFRRDGPADGHDPAALYEDVGRLREPAGFVERANVAQTERRDWVLGGDRQLFIWRLTRLTWFSAWVAATSTSPSITP